MAGAVLAPPVAGSEVPLPARILPLIHDGRFDEADRVLAATPDTPHTLEAAFFRAFVTYWRLLYDDDNDKLQEKLARQITSGMKMSHRVVPCKKQSNFLWKRTDH